MTPKEIADRLAKDFGLDPLEAADLVGFAEKHAKPDAHTLDAAARENVDAAQTVPHSCLNGVRQTLLTLLKEEFVASTLSPADRAKNGHLGASAGFEAVHTARTVVPATIPPAASTQRAAKMAELYKHPAMTDAKHPEHEAVVTQLVKLNEE